MQRVKRVRACACVYTYVEGKAAVQSAYISYMDRLLASQLERGMATRGKNAFQVVELATCTGTRHQLANTP